MTSIRKLKDTREHLGISQHKLARLSRVPRWWVQLYEAGFCVPRKAYIEAIKKVLSRVKGSAPRRSEKKAARP